MRTDLGGHVRKMHPGSIRYAAKQAKRESRNLERAIHAYAKSINIALTDKSLDETTLKYFKWKNRRMIASEKEELNGTR